MATLRYRNIRHALPTYPNHENPAILVGLGYHGSIFFFEVPGGVSDSQLARLPTRTLPCSLKPQSGTVSWW